MESSSPSDGFEATLNVVLKFWIAWVLGRSL